MALFSRTEQSANTGSAGMYSRAPAKMGFRLLKIFTGHVKIRLSSRQVPGAQLQRYRQSTDFHDRKELLTMGTPRKTTERQFQDAQVALAAHVKLLQGKGIEDQKLSRDPVWRKLDSRVRQIRARLRAISSMEVLNAEVAQRKTDRLARIATEKAERKASAGKPKAPKEKPAKEKSEAKAAKKEKAPAKPKKEAAAE